MSRLVAAAGLLVAAALPLGAQVDPSGPWETWTSEHFRIHARRELAPWAERLVREAERAWELLASELRPPRGRIDIALLDNVDFSNGIATFFPTNRITLYLPAPAGTISLDVYDDWLRLVTTHELVHVFHLDRGDGVWRVPRWVLGRNPAFFPNAYQPSWVAEGLATYYESRFTTAGRIRGGFHGQLLTSMAGAGQWPAPNDATFGTSVWPAGFRPYAWGSRFFQGAAERHGDSVIPRFVERTSRQLWPIAISGPLRSAGADGVDEAWAALRDRWTPERAGPRGRVLVRGLRVVPHPRLSSDGSRLAYVHIDGRNPSRVVVVDRTTGRIGARHSVNGQVDLVWVGDTVYLTQLDLTSPVEVYGDLYRWIPGGSWERRTRGARLRAPFGWDQGTVGVVASGPGTRTLVGYGPTSQRPEPLPAPPAADWGRVARSPDGRLVAAARHLHGRWDIVIYPARAPERLIMVTDDAALDGDPTWSPDGAMLLFTSERYGLPQIFGYRLGAREVVRLTDEPAGARDAGLAPDGTLVYSTMLFDGHAIVALDEPVIMAVPVQTVQDRSPVVEPAAPVTVSHGSYNPWPTLAPRYWTPLGHRERTAGRFFGAATSAPDLIGRFGYSAFVAYSPSTSRWEAAASVRLSWWRTLGVDAGADQTWEFGGRGLTTAGDTVPLALRERFGRLGLTWRWRRWRTSVAVRAGAEIEQDALFNDGSVPPGLGFASRDFAGGVISVSGRYARRAALSISAEDGLSAGVLYRRRWELGGSGWSDEWRGTLIGYLALPLPGFARWVLAARVKGAVSGGPTPSLFAVGGESSGRLELVPGLELGGSRRTFPLRGYPANRERFTRVVTGALELRIPLWLVGRSIWKLPLGVDRVSLTAFVETGGGWVAGGPARLTPYRDVGAEGVFDLFAGFDFRLRIRIGAAVALADGLGVSKGDAREYLAIGSSF